MGGQDQSKLVVAIEIGNVNSGYAYGIGTDKRYQINTATHGYGLPSNRVPTILLLKKDGTFDSFGDFAKDKFMSLSLQGKQDQYKYFDTIKVVQEEGNKLVVYDSNKENKILAEDLYFNIIDHLYDTCMEQVEKCPRRDFKMKIFHIIVPNNTDYVHDVIKSALQKTKLEEKSVNFVLDTDAAATYCRHQPLLKYNKSFILANLGGCLSTFCCQTISSTMKYEKLVCCSSLPYGGESITDSFITNLFGKDVDLDEYKKDHAYDFMCMRQAFDENKHKFDGNNESMIMELPSSFVSFLRKNEKSNNMKKLSVTEDNKTFLTKEQMKDMFMKSKDEIVSKLKTEFDEEIKQKNALICLAGGFSESPYLREVITKELKSNDVILVPEPQLAVLKGAVIMGFADTLRARCDFGFIRKDKPTCISDSIKTTYKGNDVIFQIILRKGQMVKANDTFHATLPIPENERKMDIVLYKRKTSDTGNTDEVGQIDIKDKTPPPENGWEDEVTVVVRLTIKNNHLAFNMTATTPLC